MAKSKKIRDLNPTGRKPYGVFSRFEEYFNLLMNAVKITAKEGAEMPFPVEAFVKRGLFENGSMGYDKLTGKWFYVDGEGVNEFGNPSNLVLTTANGVAMSRPASYEDKEDGAYLIKALPIEMSMAELIRETTDFMTSCDVAMRQNVEACKTPYVVVCKDEDLRLSFEHALQAKQTGQAVLLVSAELGDGLSASKIAVDFLSDKFEAVRDRERDTLLNKLGIMTANVDKKERIQSAEVNASIGQSTDYIYLLIDTFNKQCETYGLPFEMSLNGSLEEIYLDGKEEGEAPDANVVEERNNLND